MIIKKFKCAERKTTYNPKTELEIKFCEDDGTMAIFLDREDVFTSIRLTKEQTNKLKNFLKGEGK